MKRFALAFGLMALMIGGVVTADEKGLKELEGTYKMTHAEKSGTAARKELVDAGTVTITGDEFVITFGPDDKKVSKIKVNADAKPATIDIVPSDGDAKGKTFPGIYKLEKGELTLVFSEKGDRPKEFKSDDEAILLKLKKVEKK